MRTKYKQNKDKFNRLKIIAWYEVIVSSLIYLLLVYSVIITKVLFIPLNFFLATLGIMGGILLLKNKRAGFYMSILWAFLQILIVQINNFIIDTSQLLYLLLTLDLNPEINLIISLNFFGLILLILLIKWRKELTNKNAQK